MIETIYQVHKLKNYKKTLEKNTQAEMLIQETIDLLYRQYEYIMALENEADEGSSDVNSL